MVNYQHPLFTRSTMNGSCQKKKTPASCRCSIEAHRSLCGSCGQRGHEQREDQNDLTRRTTCPSVAPSTPALLRRMNFGGTLRNDVPLRNDRVADGGLDELERERRLHGEFVPPDVNGYLRCRDQHAQGATTLLQVLFHSASPFFDLEFKTYLEPQPQKQIPYDNPNSTHRSCPSMQ